ncbi:MAG: metallophosphoesterase family protein [Candidatus Thorarchaeota archaeon]|nr:MAG: hypothetical protein DRP09_11485 [Candidatus Thorarchaeota archaeon]
MSARIAHISDTHLGTNPRRGVRPNVWGQERKSQLLENDFYERFAEIFNRIAELDPPVDLVVHSGDLFNSPWEGNPQQASVMAQNTAISVLQDFIKKTGIPVLIIEGNHGLYRLRDVSILENLKLAVEGVDVATQQDLKWAIREGEPLMFYYDNLDVYCFPFIDYPVLKASQMVDTFNDWISTYQKPDSKRPSVGVAHGMELDKTLYPAIFSMDYDYVALGHDHRQRKVSPKCWYAGSPERWRFDEAGLDKGFLVVDIELNKDPKVTQHKIEFARPVINETLAIDADETKESLTSKVEAWFVEKGLRTSWDPATAARVRLMFEGVSKTASSFELNVALEALQMQVLSTDSEYNIAQFVSRVQQTAGSDVPDGAYPEIESEFLIEDPSTDFKEYLSTLTLDKSVDPDLLTKIAVNALQYAVGTREGKMTVDSVMEGEE